MTETLAIVTMRHNSERVPGKNYRPLAGIPLYHYVIRTLSAVPEEPAAWAGHVHDSSSLPAAEMS
jgi:spore coat polysaccharide biosynthesis protein SpsF (cytidylyltransferase family)